MAALVLTLVLSGNSGDVLGLRCSPGPLQVGMSSTHFTSGSCEKRLGEGEGGQETWSYYYMPKRSVKGSF